MKVFVVGYYGHNNIGDEQYKLSFQYLFQMLQNQAQQPQITEVEFVDCDKLKNAQVAVEDLVVLGGGDILNNYFLDTLRAKFCPAGSGAVTRRPNIVAVSVGIPYASIVIQTPEKLAVIDAIFIRTKQEVDVLSEYFLPSRIFFLPDISFLLLCGVPRVPPDVVVPVMVNGYSEYLQENSLVSAQYNQTVTAIRRTISSYKNAGYKVVALSLNRHIYSAKYAGHYKNLVDKLSDFVIIMLQNNLVPVFLPFNTSPHVTVQELNMENDVLIHGDVLENVSAKLVSQFGNRAGAILSRIVMIGQAMDVGDLLALYDYFDLTVPMRFHACLFSTYKQVPMLPIFTTKKIRNLLLDLEWESYYELETNSVDIPVDIDVGLLWTKFSQWGSASVRAAGKSHLKQICDRFFANGLQIGVEALRSFLFTDLLVGGSSGGSGSTRVAVTGFPNKNDATIAALFARLSEYAGSLGVSDFRLLKDPEARSNAVSIASYYLTNNVDSIYNHGMESKMFVTVPIVSGATGTPEAPGDAVEEPKFNYRSEWLWILKDRQMTKCNFSNPFRRHVSSIFRLDYLDQCDYSKVHRSGWQYVYEHVAAYNNPNGPILLDLYLDKTFHWKSAVYRLLGIVPYRQAWAGFIHHTFDTTFSEYNIPNMFKNADFVESLKYCKGIFVLSRTLKQQLENYMSNFATQPLALSPETASEVGETSPGISGVPRLPAVPPVFAFVHPTEVDNIPRFNMKRFLANTDKKLVHVGGWLRNIFSFYFLKLPNVSTYTVQTTCCIRMWTVFNPLPNTRTSTSVHKLRKVAIKGNQMNNYYPEPALLDKIRAAFSANSGVLAAAVDNELSIAFSKNCSTGSGTGSGKGVVDNITNNWNKHLFDFLETLCKDVEVVEHLPNEDYDAILTENVVFINLVDASAVNTLLECIVRNTPIVVNRHPAVVELLGPRYPLYYGDAGDAANGIGGGNLVAMNKQVDILLSDLGNVDFANQYLQKLDKKQFRIETFITQLLTVSNFMG